MKEYIQMKKWTIQFELLEGNDEFWDDAPTPYEILQEVKRELDLVNLDIENLRCVKFIDETEYFEEESLNNDDSI
jgi:hypothetical protein